MLNFRVTLFLLVFFIAATFPAESKNCWCNKDADKEPEKQIFLGFRSVQDKLKEALKNKKFPDRTKKIQFMQKLLKKLTNVSQKPVKDLLKSLNIPFRSLWISNGMFLAKSAYEKIKDKLKLIPGILVARLEQELKFTAGEVSITEQEMVLELAEGSTMDCPPTGNLVTWGLGKLDVRKAWEISDGSGIVIGSIDTGFRLTHEAIRSRYLNSDHSWLDPIEQSAKPRDADTKTGHGTHTIGTMVGENGIGVAPGAQFIACIGCDDKTCKESWLLACFQFMLCPTRPDGSDEDCRKAPRVVNNSWGYKGGEFHTNFLDAIKNWINAGIVPVFSIGNNGPNCNTTSSPGNLVEAIGVAASDVSDMIAEFSGRGPAPDNPKRIKPDITAPGVQICSASFKGDNQYNLLNGTSMAAPHISGIVALMLQANPDAAVDEVKGVLYNPNALQTEGLKTKDRKWTCNENLTDSDNSERHDNYFGRGISIASEAVNLMKKRKRNHK